MGPSAFRGSVWSSMEIKGRASAVPASRPNRLVSRGLGLCVPEQQHYALAAHRQPSAASFASSSVAGASPSFRTVASPVALTRSPSAALAASPTHSPSLVSLEPSQGAPSASPTPPPPPASAATLAAAPTIRTRPPPCTARPLAALSQHCPALVDDTATAAVGTSTPPPIPTASQTARLVAATIASSATGSRQAEGAGPRTAGWSGARRAMRAVGAFTRGGAQRRTTAPTHPARPNSPTTQSALPKGQPPPSTPASPALAPAPGHPSSHSAPPQALAAAVAFVSCPYAYHGEKGAAAAAAVAGSASMKELAEMPPSALVIGKGARGAAESRAGVDYVDFDWSTVCWIQSRMLACSLWCIVCKTLSELPLTCASISAWDAATSTSAATCSAALAQHLGRPVTAHLVRTPTPAVPAARQLDSSACGLATLLSHTHLAGCLGAFHTPFVDL